MTSHPCKDIWTVDDDQRWVAGMFGVDGRNKFTDERPPRGQPYTL